jgi:hypothetical protein
MLYLFSTHQNEFQNGKMKKEKKKILSAKAHLTQICYEKLLLSAWLLVNLGNKSQMLFFLKMLFQPRLKFAFSTLKQKVPSQQQRCFKEFDSRNKKTNIEEGLDKCNLVLIFMGNFV